MSQIQYKANFYASWLTLGSTLEKLLFCTRTLSVVAAPPGYTGLFSWRALAKNILQPCIINANKTALGGPKQ